MTASENSYTSEQKAAVNAAEALGLSGTSITGDPEEWEAQAERIAEALQTHSSCIPPATSGWNQTVRLPTTWAIWWVKRLIHATHGSDCGTGGIRSPKTGK